MIHIVVSEDRNKAYRLFMTLNDRGKSLSAGDLLKSHTLELLEGYSDTQEKTVADWSEILKEGDKKVENFLRAYLPSQTGTRAGRLTLYDNFCDAFFSFDSNLSQSESEKISHAIEEMVHESATYHTIVKGDWPYEDSTTTVWSRDRLSRLSDSKILKHARCYPLLLAVKHCLSEEQFVEVVQMLELFIFRYVIICKVHPGRLGDTYYEHCKRIRQQNENYSVADLRSDLKELMVQDTSDSIFKDRLTERLVYSESASKMILHFLSTLEDYHHWYDTGCQGKPRPDQTSVFNIPWLEVEHIYPQNARNINEELEPLKHDLGNLSFWIKDHNKEASNADFPQKRTMYANSSISLNRDLAKLDTWNPAKLQERRKKLVDMAVKIFTI